MKRIIKSGLATLLVYAIAIAIAVACLTMYHPKFIMSAVCFAASIISVVIVFKVIDEEINNKN